MINYLEIHCSHNTKELVFPGGGTLQGFSNKKHIEFIKTNNEGPSLNIFLDAHSFPLDFLFANTPELLPVQSLGPRILLFSIPDQSVPSQRLSFTFLIDKATETLKQGGRVNVSCMGGHGRTGLVLSILYGLLTASKTPIEDVRAKYCNKAVESFVQKEYVHCYLNLQKPQPDPKYCYLCHARMDPEEEFYSCWSCTRERQIHQNAIAVASIIKNPVGFGPAALVHNMYLEAKPGVKAVYCQWCKIRAAQPFSDACGQCAAAEHPVEVVVTPTSFLTGLSRNKFKRLIKRWNKDQQNFYIVNVEDAQELLDKLDQCGLMEMTEDEAKFYAYFKWPEE